jgi:ribose transport system permease protein
MKRCLSEYGMLPVLVLLCAVMSWLTWGEQRPSGAAAAREVAAELTRTPGVAVLIVARAGDEDREFVETLAARLREQGRPAGSVLGSPQDARRALEAAVRIDVVACTAEAAAWPLWEDFKGLRVVSPAAFRGPLFLRPANLIDNVANRAAVYAIIAIGMTLVIITGGIDLSVGSLVALSAVVAALLIRAGGAQQAGAGTLLLASIAAIGVSAAVGLLTASLVTAFAVPPFIVTLAMMLVASGAAFLLSGGQSVYELPDAFLWLGRGKVAGLPNSLVVMVVLYVVAHVVLSRMSLGRYVYAVGGNAEAARLSGVPVRRVLLFVYTACGALAGLGGIVTASQLKSGSPTYGLMYELNVIAAVVVGGTSLSGGQGRMFGTLIGALIIAVIENGMNLLGIQSYTQKVVLGLVILGAVLADRLRSRLKG